MSTWFLLISMLLVIIGLILCLATIVKKILKRPSKKLESGYKISLTMGVVMMIVSSTSKASDLTLLVAVVAFFMVPLSIIQGIIRRLYCKLKGIEINKSHKIWIFTIVFLAISIIAYMFSNALVKAEQKKYLASNELNEDLADAEFVTELDFDVEDGYEPIEVETSRGFDTTYANTYRFVFDTEDVPLLLNYGLVTSENCIAVVENSTTIDPAYKPLFEEFIMRIGEKYPDADLRILYHNLFTLEVYELSQTDYLMKAMSADSLGCYRRDENKIYIPKGTTYTEGEFGYQVLLHEFCHACRSSWYTDDIEQQTTKRKKTAVRKNNLQFDSLPGTTLLEESMNSVFSCSLLSYDEWDIAYQVPSNYLRIMLECMDNYELTDYINHSDAYFLRKLDEQTGYTNYAQTIWKLITLQRNDWSKDGIDIPAEEYNPIYKYLGDLYFDKYITSEMSSGEAQKVAEELTRKAFWDAPEDYKINSEFFSEYLKEWRLAHHK